MKLANIELPNKINFNNIDLFLNGAAVRTKFFVQTYIISLYSAEKITDEKIAIESNIERCLRMTIVSPLATPTLVALNIEAGIKESLGNKAAFYKDTIDEVTKILQNAQIGYKDSIDNYYTKDGKLLLYKNGILLGENNDGKIFAESLFNLYMGKHPKDRKIKEALLKGF